MTVWSPQQNEALSKAAAWLRLRYQPSFYLGGFAGTGKSTLAKHLAAQADGKVAFAAFTGKAARVMRSKGCAGASTIHALIYWTEMDTKTGKSSITRKSRADLEGVVLIVIDECSMVDEEMGRDLLHFGIPVLVLGDPAQLPPIRGAGFFTSGQPDYMLTEVHRQAADSPIISLATAIREGRSLPGAMQVPGLTIVHQRDLDPTLVTSADTVIVGRNDTRQKYNRRLRELLGFTASTPYAEEPLICLRNDREKKIANGEIFLAHSDGKPSGRYVSVKLTQPEDPSRKPFVVDIRKEFFVDDKAATQMPFKTLRGSQQFTYGYAITCHKSQGSQWPSVCVFDESQAFEERARWLYTAVTRAAENLTLVTRSAA